MLHTENTSDIQAMFDAFQTPMFMAERENPDASFEIICINTAHCSTSGLDRNNACGAPLQEILPASEAQQVEARWRTCAETRAPQRCLESMTLPHGVIHWDTALQHIAMPSGSDRVIGISFQLQQLETSDRHQSTFEDINYFSTLADLQVQNLVSVFENVQREGLFCDHSRARVEHLASICRSVQQALKNVQDTARRGHDDRQRTAPIAQQNAPKGPDISCTVQALFASMQQTEDC